ncbi:MAG: hypothetical protein M1823_005074 [Watsoniomyces obsoletus]|nr:MAG: hypothetical protein M1823_005074 [Watsoniomyces obsoletus]
MKRPVPSELGRVSPPPLRRKVQSGTTKDAVNTFFKPASEKPPEKTSWHVRHGTLLVAQYASEKKTPKSSPEGIPEKVAAFDLDSTLIETSSGKRHANGEQDWKWWDPSVPGTLRELHEKGFRVIIMSNQGGIRLKPDPKTIKGDLHRLGVFKQKIGAVLVQLDLPINLYAATGDDNFRKPRTEMWTEMRRDYHLDALNAIDLSASFYVGDAGGRSGNKGTRNDHACSDRNYAANIGIQFHTPEEFFHDGPSRPFKQSFDPAMYLSSAVTESALGTELYSKSNPLDLVLFCGSPGAGKSTFYWNHLKPLRYERVNQDLLKTRDRCIQLASEQLSKGISVAVDNTNAEPETRAKWVDLARKYGVPIRCVWFTAPTELCRHNSTVRALHGGKVSVSLLTLLSQREGNAWEQTQGDFLDRMGTCVDDSSQMNPEDREMLPSVAFRSFASRFRPPKLDEGFQDITKLDFQVRALSHVIEAVTASLSRPTGG